MRVLILIAVASVAVVARAGPPPLTTPAPASTTPAPQWNPTADPPQAEPVAIEREYDRFQDKTTIKMEGIRPSVTKGESRLFINVTSSCDGTTVTVKPQKVAINLLAVSEDFQYADLKDSLQLILLINNNRVRVPARFMKAGTSKDRSPRALESFVAIIDADVLLQMATGRTVEGQLGSTEFKLGPMEQLSLRKFAEAVKLVDPMPKGAAAAMESAISTGPVRADAVAIHLAQARIDELQEKVDRLTAMCLGKLEQSKDYVAACDAATDLEAQKDKTPAGPQRANISQQWLEARAKVALTRSSALLEDGDLAAARRELSDAQANMRSLQHAFERSRHPSASR